MQNAQEAIIRRKSIRKYLQAPFDAVMLANLEGLLAAAQPLFDDAAYKLRLVTAAEFQTLCKGQVAKAPHYLLLQAEDSEEGRLNCGFIGEQIVLQLTDLAIGSCWLGMARPRRTADFRPPLQIVIALGPPAQPFRAAAAEAKRKPLAEIFRGEAAPPPAILQAVEAARLAPSAMNGQPWYFWQQGGQIHCYRKAGRLPHLARMQAVDLGIAIAHLLAVEPTGRLLRLIEVPQLQGYHYVGSIEKKV